MSKDFTPAEKYEAALAEITEPDKREKFIAEWQDRHSGLSDIGGYCHKLAFKVFKEKY